jgi:serine/threonine protein kinase
MRDLGDTVDLPDQIGRFRIKRVLGSGAMGVVCLAEDPVLGREVAIKAIQLHPGLSEKQIVELRQRFETEARAAAKLAHPNLVTIFDAGLEQENLYIAMEFVEGEGLDSMLEGGRQLAPEEISQLVGQLASALDYAHADGIVHRDIKPANVLVSRLGHVKITDFGVARQAASTQTATGAMIGTPAYMSPEQVTGNPVSGASDQFCSES